MITDCEYRNTSVDEDCENGHGSAQEQCGKEGYEYVEVTNTIIRVWKGIYKYVGRKLHDYEECGKEQFAYVEDMSV